MLSLLLASGVSHAAWYDTNWTARQEITISSTVADADLTDYPYLVRIVDPANDLFTDAQASGNDILFTAADGSTKLSHEIEFYDAATNTLYAWVRVPLVSSTADTTLYIYYGYASATDQQNITGTWDDDFVMVQHLQGTSGTHLDSTSNNNDGTPQNGVTQNATGRIDGADQFDGSNDYVSVPDNANLQIVEMTVEAWVYVPSSIPSSYHSIVNHAPSSSNWYGLWNNSNRFHFRWSNETVRRTDFSSTFSPDQWYYVAGVLDVTNDRAITYQNEATDTVVPGPDLPTPTSGPTYIGTTFSGSERFKGFIDEVRVSKVARSPAWIRATYRSQNTPGSYMTLGPEQSSCPGGVVSTTSDGLIPGSLRSCVIWANSNPGADTITVPAGTYTLTLGASGEDGALGGDLDILENLTINGAGAASTIVDGNGSDRLFHVLAGVTGTISGMTLQNGNAGGGRGGGIRNDGTLILDNAVVTGNTDSNEGGGIHSSGAATSLTITNSTVSANSNPGGKGGGIFVLAGGFSITDSTISGNNADEGGGLRNFDGTGTLTRVTISGNTAGTGGGIMNRNTGANMTLTNVTVSGNSATSEGGGIQQQGNSMTLTNVTVTNNTAPSNGGGLHNKSGTSTLTNTIIANNPSGGDCVGTITAGTDSLDSDGSCGGATTASPLLGVLQDNGGQTETHALLAGSPAIEGGTNTGCPTTDQRSFSRPNGALCDIGAYEAEVTAICTGGIVTTTADSTTGGSLRACVIWANSNPGADTITLPAGTYNLTLGTVGEDLAAEGDLDILEDLTITGAGARTTVIDGWSNDRIFDVYDGHVFTISGMTLRNGDALTDGADGGAIDNHSATITITDVTISGNSAKNGGALGSSGGNSAYVLERVTLSGNTAEKSGAIINSSGGDTTTMTNVTITGNTATVDTGAGDLDDADLVNVTIVDNTAPPGKIGGILESGGGFTAINTIIANNTGGDCNNTAVTSLNSIDSDGSCGLNTTADPKLDPLADNGGPTDTMMPQSDSPAIEGGTNSFCATVDQRLITRPQGTLCDVGAVEVVLNQITGTVFEDVNYGGGLGRDLATAAPDAPSFTVGRSGATVELYTAAGTFVSSTTTVAGGSYLLYAIPGTYTVRVVNSTVTSSRPGSDGSELAVQTYRIDGVSEAAGDGARKVGGELPSNEDAAANSGAQTLASLQGSDLDADGIPEWTQSIVTVDASAGDVSGVDFGFNFDVVVNTNDSGQGSLRQFILNSNLLTWVGPIRERRIAAVDLLDLWWNRSAIA